MNKAPKLFAAVSLIMLSSANGATSHEVDSTLSYVNNLKIGKTLTLRIRGTDLFLNGFRLGPSALFLNQKHIREIVNIGKYKLALNCPEGTYKHWVKIDGVEKVANGCLGDPNYKRVHSAFRNLEADSTLNGEGNK